MSDEPATSTARARRKLKPLTFTPLAPETTFQYADLNIIHDGNMENTLNMVKRAIRMGYDAVAINIDIGDIAGYQTDPGNDLQIEFGTAPKSAEPPAKKKKRNKNVPEGFFVKKQLPKPIFVDQTLLDLSELQKRGKVFRQFSRITFTANTQVVLNKTFGHPKILDFDLVAVRPADDSVLDTLSRKSEFFDIVSMDLSEKNKWLGSSKMLERMRGEGIFYEISYADALTDRVKRQMSLYNGRILLRALRSRGVFLSSGAQSMIDLRAPVDTMNLALLWGISNSIARTFISGNPKLLLLQSECRGTENGELHSMPLPRGDDVSNDGMDTSEGGTKSKDAMEKTKPPPIEVTFNHLQYEKLLKATKTAHDLAKTLREQKQNKTQTQPKTPKAQKETAQVEG